MGDAPPPGRAEFDRLVEEHGIGKMVEWMLDGIASAIPAPAEAAPPDAAARVKRQRGRPRRPYYDDTALLQAAAAHWRQTRGPSVWPSLLEAGGGESGACRLRRRLDEWSGRGCLERGILDFYLQRWQNRVERVFGRTDRFADLTGYLLTMWGPPVDPVEEQALREILQSLPLPALLSLMQKGVQTAGRARREDRDVGAALGSLRAWVFATYKKSGSLADYFSVDFEQHPPFT